MYIDPIIQKYIDLLKANNGEIKAFFQGEPTKVAVSLLPCVFISKGQTNVGKITNVEDQHEIGLSVALVTDIRKELSTNENDNHVVEGVAKLYDMMEGRDATYVLKTTSILNILRTNQLVDVDNNLRTDLTSITTVDYGETLQERNPAEWRIEARINLVAHFIQNR